MQEGVKWLKVSSKKYALDGYGAISAGTRPVSMVNPIATEVMKEVGIDISSPWP